MEISIEQTSNLFPNGCTLIAYSLEGNRLGHAHISLHDSEAILADIIISSFTIHLIPFIPFLKRKVCYRNKGVGTKLLQKVIELCNSSGISVLSGNMHGETDRLARWYSKNGFMVNGNHISLRFNACPIIHAGRLKEPLN